jgi:transposase
MKQTEYGWVYLFGASAPETGESHACLLPRADTEAMGLYLADFGRNLAPDVHALVVMDGAGWHTNGGLPVPENVTLVRLPPYAPELNPAELVWRELRQKHLSNRAFADESELWAAVETAWLAFARDPAAIRSLTGFPWIQAGRNNMN